MIAMTAQPELKRPPAPEAEHTSIVTKLTELVRFTEQVKPEKQKEDTRTIKQIAQLAHALVEEISSHWRARDRRTAKLENLATPDPLTRVLSRRGFEDCLLHELSVARRHGVG